MLEWVQDFTHNQFFSGIAGASVVGAGLYWCRQVPQQIWKCITWISSYQVEISNDTALYSTVITWISRNGTERWHNRKFKLLEQRASSPDHYDAPEYEDNTPATWLLSPGFGRHWLTFERRPVSVDRESTNEKNASGSFVREVVKLRLYSRDRERLNRLIDQLRATEDEGLTTAIYLWRRDYWRLVERRRPRPLTSIILPSNTLDNLAADMRRFLDNKTWYLDRGIPYRRGYLFTGEPGTGKSSAALALAGYLHLPMYVLNFGSIANDDGLIDAISSIPAHSILLIEDIDTAAISRDRQDNSGDRSKGPSLGALLNVLDGTMARDGRLLIITANRPQLVDTAVLRPGRVDYRVEFGLAGRDEAARLFENFFPDVPEIAATLRSNRVNPQTPADIQALLVTHADRPHDAVKALLNREINDGSLQHLS